MESLTMLAIVGVLSMVGMWGYQRSMNRHYANEILDEARMRVLSCMTVLLNLITGPNKLIIDFV